MSLKPAALDDIPVETARVARAAFPNGNIYIRVRDELGPLYRDESFSDLFPTRGRPVESPGRLALVTVFQFAEGLSDRAAADAVRSRIDWKYALGLELTDPGFDSSVLTEFRARLVSSDQARLLFDTLLGQLREAKLVKADGRQRTDSTRVLAAVHNYNRLECVWEAMRSRARTPSPKSHPTGCARRPRRRGTNATRGGPKASASPSSNGGNSPSRSALTAMPYSTPFTPPRHRPPSGTYQRSSLCAASGCSSFALSRGPRAGASRPTTLPAS